MSFPKIRIVTLLFVVYLFVPLSAFAQEKIAGHWKQYVWEEQSQRWKNLGIYVVYSQAGNYLMAPINQKMGKNVINTSGLFGVTFTEAEWRFKSDWGDGKVAEFQLNKIVTGTYHGWAYLNGQRVNENLWVLIK